MSLALEIAAGVVLAIIFIAVMKSYFPSILPRVLGFSLFGAALIYVSFAGIGIALANTDSSWFIFELGGLVFYSVFAYLGIRSSPWYLAVGWALHVMWDVSFHTDAQYVPAIYPGICIGFDVLLAMFAVYLSLKVSEN